MVKVQRLFAKTNLKIPIFRDEKDLNCPTHFRKSPEKRDFVVHTHLYIKKLDKLDLEGSREL